jgi:O-succinylbenzoate synthase
MTITSFIIYRYSLPLVRALKFKDIEIASREGFLVCLTGDNCRTGWGEAAPLPAFSNESLPQVLTELTSALPQLLGKPVPDNLEKLDGGFERRLGPYHLSPSSRFAVESAILNLIASSRGVSLARLLTPNPLDTLRINGFVTGTSQEVIERSRMLQRDGFRAIKIKVGRGKLDDDIATVKNVSRELDSRSIVRLDANRAWSLDEAIRFAELIDDVRVEFIEEPVKNAAILREFLNRTKAVPDHSLPVALDESLLEMSPDDLRQWDGVDAIILKPMLLGGIENAVAFAQVAREMKINAIVSSSFESSLGITVLGQIAAAFGTPGAPVGLDTVNWLSQDVLKERISLSGGKMLTAQLARAAMTVDTSKLQEVVHG